MLFCDTGFSSNPDWNKETTNKFFFKNRRIKQMIELGKYGAHILSAYSITILILIYLSVQTIFSFTNTKKKLAKISQKKLEADEIS